MGRPPTRNAATRNLFGDAFDKAEQERQRQAALKKSREEARQREIRRVRMVTHGTRCREWDRRNATRAFGRGARA